MVLEAETGSIYPGEPAVGRDWDSVWGGNLPSYWLWGKCVMMLPSHMAVWEIPARSQMLPSHWKFKPGVP